MLIAKAKKGAISIQVILAVIIGIILLVGVAVPITVDVVSDANLTGLTATVAAFLPVFIIIAALVLVVSLMATKR